MNAPMKRVVSAVTALTAGAATLEVDLGSIGAAHWFLGVQFYTSLAGDTLATPTAGTIDFDVKTEALPDVYQRLPDSVDLASANEQVDWSSPSRMAKVTIAAVAGGSATHFKVIAVAVRS